MPAGTTAPAADGMAAANALDAGDAFGCVYVDVYMYIYVDVSMYVYMYMFICTCTHTHTCTCTYVGMYVYICMYVLARHLLKSRALNAPGVCLEQWVPVTLQHISWLQGIICPCAEPQGN